MKKSPDLSSLLFRVKVSKICFQNIFTVLLLNGLQITLTTTLDGQGSFHGMGIIAVSTPQDNTQLSTYSWLISRLKRIKVDEVVKDKGINISQSEKGLASVTYKPILQLHFSYTPPLELHSDLLWHSGWMFSSSEQPGPNCSGFMQHILSDNQYSTPSQRSLFCQS